MSFALSLATRGGSKPPKASRMPSHFASTTRQLIPDWNMTRAIASR
jgi:hypothetical protein